MGIAEDIYARCRVCIIECDKLLTAILDNKPPNPLAVHARRYAADMASDAVYATLTKAFITPLDREDLWQLHLTAEHLRRSAETAALAFENASLSPENIDIIRKVSLCCQGALQLAERFPTVGALAPYLRLLRETENALTAPTTARLLPIVKACARLAETWRYLALKNT